MENPLESQLAEGDVLSFAGHTATVFAISNGVTWIIEKDGHGPVYIMPLAALKRAYPGYMRVYRPDPDNPLEIYIKGNKNPKTPYQLIKKQHLHIYLWLKNHNIYNNILKPCDKT